MKSNLRFQEIHIENTNACGYKCVMCPRDKQTRKLGLMSLEDFSLVLEKAGPYSEIFHLHGFGETLLDRQFPKKVQMLKKEFPRSKAQIFSTLGVKVKESYFTELAESGLDDLGVSLYGFTQETYKKVHGFDGWELVKKNLQLLSQAVKLSNSPLKSYIKIPGQTISGSLPVAFPPERTEFCKWAQDLGFEIMEWSYVHNYGNGRNYNKPNEQKLCPVIAGKRKEILNITWDLSVVPCCYDFNASIRFGNLRENTLEEIFSGREYFNFVLAHKMNHLANYPVCQNCEKNDYE